MPNELENLYAEYEAAQAAFREIPREEVRAYWDNGQPDGPVKEAFDRIGEISRKIGPLQRNMESDLHAIFGNGSIRTDDALAVEIYAALCNVQWRHENGSRYSCSWRYAGELVASLRGRGDYMDWYCSGNEGTVSERVSEQLEKKGWTHESL